MSEKNPAVSSCGFWPSHLPNKTRKPGLLGWSSVFLGTGQQLTARTRCTPSSTPHARPAPGRLGCPGDGSRGDGCGGHGSAAAAEEEMELALLDCGWANEVEDLMDQQCDHI